MTKLIDGDSVAVEYKSSSALVQDLSIGAYLVEEDRGKKYVFIVDPAIQDPLRLYFVLGNDLAVVTTITTGIPEERKFRLICQLDFTPAKD